MDQELSAATRPTDPSSYMGNPRPQARPHAAFGFGAHVRLGASLARMEARVVFDEMLRAFPDFQVTGPAVRGKSTHGAIVERLPAAFGARARASAGV